MSSKKTKYRFLSGAFILIIFGVGLVQAGIELAHRERPQVLDLFLHAPTEKNLRLFEKGLEDASWFAQRLRPWTQYLQFVLLDNGGENMLAGREDWLFYKPGVEYLVEPWENNAEVASVIVSFRDQLAARGVHLLVMPAPGKASIYPERVTARAGREINAHTRKLMSLLRDSGVEVVDLFDVFDTSRGEAQLYLRQDTHWSPAGVQLAAQTVAERILSLGWVEKRNVPYKTRPTRVTRYGDVLRMMEAPQIERRFTPEDIACAQIVRSDTGALYQDDPASEILVLGDSFLRIYEQDEPRSAGFIAHLARELGQPLASIVNDGGASTLVRQELARKPALLDGKKLVIWEFVERDIRFGAEGWQDIELPKPMK